MADSSKHSIVDSVEKIKAMLDRLENLPKEEVSLFMDLEGIDLCRHGSISILQLYSLPEDHAYLIDVHSLQGDAFQATSSDGKASLKSILESSATKKAIFDVRNDSDALFAHFGIHLSGMVDIQLLELATRSGSRRLVNGLGRCVDRDLAMAWAARQECSAIKERGRKLFAPEKGGRYEVFNERPLPPDLIEYCVQDVRVLPQLFRQYDSKISDTWRMRVHVATVARIEQSHSRDYNGRGRHMALGPTGW